MKPASRLFFGDTSPSPTAIPLRTLWLLSVLIFLINYTFEVLDFNHLYESQQFLLVLLQLTLSLWALLEWALLRKSQTAMPLVGLGLALSAQMLTGLTRLPLGWLMENGRAHVENPLSHFDSPVSHFDLGLAAVYVPLNLLMFLLISKLLIDAFAFTERQRAVLLQREIETRLRAEAALQAANAKLQRLATTDRLTGAWNRTYLEETLVTEMERANRYRQPLSLLIFDIDHFKGINDTHGHLVGDEVLIELTRRIRAHLRTVDVLARWGGEEFVLLLPHCGATEAQQVAEKLRALVADSPFSRAGQVTASIGLAQWQPHESLDTWLKRADDALYAAKAAGRNRVRLAE